MVGIGDFVGGLGNVMAGVVQFLVYIAIGAGVMGIFFLIWKYKQYNYEALIFSRTKSGIQVRKCKGGYTKNPRDKSIVFKILSPKYKVNNFDPDQIIRSTLKKQRPQVYLWQRKDNKVIQLDSNFREKKDGKMNLQFFPRQLGIDDFEEEFDKATENLFKVEDLWSKYSNTIVQAGMITTLVIMNVVLLSKLAS